MLMSLGEIPGMRDAWAMVSGSIFVNFCLASVESDLMSLYTSLPFNDVSYGVVCSTAEIDFMQ